MLQCSAAVVVDAHNDLNLGQQGRVALWGEREEDFCFGEEGRWLAEGEEYSETKPYTGSNLLAENETMVKSEDGLWVSISCSLALEVHSSYSRRSCWV
jgi:hypothetical protein